MILLLILAQKFKYLWFLNVARFARNVVKWYVIFQNCDFFFFAVSTNGFQRSTTVAQSFSLYSTNPQSIEDVVQPELLQTNNASSSNSGTLMHHNLNMLQHSNNNNIHTASSNNGMTMMSGAQDRNFRRRRRRKQIFWKR